MTRKLLGAEPVEADIRMYGSFAATGKGHGTDRAIIAGLLGMEPDDMRIPESFAIAEKEGMKFTFGTADLKGAHPNSVVLHVKGKNGRERKVQACSLGGGRIMINELDGIELNCTCEMPDDRREPCGPAGPRGGSDDDALDALHQHRDDVRLP